MKKNLFIVFLLILFGCKNNQKEYEPDRDKYDAVDCRHYWSPASHCYVNYFLVNEINKKTFEDQWGLIKEGSLILSCDYEEIDILTSGEDLYWLVKKDKQYGVFDEKGKEIFPVKYRREQFSFENGFLILSVENNEKLVDDMFVWIGKTVFGPVDYVNTDININGDEVFRFRYNYGRPDQKSGIAKLTGEKIIEVPFFITKVVETENGESLIFSGGGLNREFTKPMKAGFTSKTGEMIIPYQYFFYLGSPKEGVITFSDEKSTGYFDYQGKKKVLSEEYCIISNYESGKAIIRDRTTKKIGVIDKIGNIIFPCEYDSTFEVIYSSITDDIYYLRKNHKTFNIRTRKFVK